MKTRLLTILLALCMAASLISVPALAEGEELSAEPTVETVEETPAPEATAEPIESAAPSEATDDTTPPADSEDASLATNAASLTSELSLDGTDDHSNHCVCGTGTLTAGGHSCTPITDWEPWSDKSSLPEGNGYNSKHYYLTEDVTLNLTWYPASGIVLCLNGHSITNSAGGPAIYINSGSSLTITDCKNEGTITATKDTGIHIRNSSELDMYGGSITGCSADGVYHPGGGVYVESGATFNMYGGSIAGNKVTYGGSSKGGGVYNKGAFNMHGGSITGNQTEKSGNYASNGGGVYNDKGTFNIYGGTISENTTPGSGGGVYSDGGTFTMSGGTIEKNSAGYGGGGVYQVNSISTSSTAEAFRMSGGTISNNSASLYGGGVHIVTGTFVMSNNAAITGNRITDSYGNGGGVHCADYGYITLSGSVQITRNTKKETTNNVSLRSTKSITASSLTTAARIGITASENQTVVTGSTSTAIFTSDSDSYKLTVDGSGLKLVANLPPHVHCVCGAGSLTANGHEHNNTQEWTAVSSLSEITTGGYYYLTNNVTITSSSSPNHWKSPNGVVLCLNGKSITSTTSAEVIQIVGGRTLTITDCKGTGKITHTANSNGRGIYCTGTFNLYGGSITGNATTDSNGGGGVFVYSSGTFNMYGGSITENHANTTTGKGWGGGVSNNGTFHMYGGAISDNTAAHSGGGVCNSGTFTMSGNAVISGNTAAYNGGGVRSYVLGGEGVSFTMDGGSITGNRATSDYYGDGGGVCIGNGTVTLKGAAKITGNTSGSATAPTTNNLYLPTGMTVTADELSEGANIGVTTATAPSANAPITITNDGCSTAYFRSDVEGYTVEASGTAVALAVKQITPTTYTVTVNATNATPDADTQSVTVGSSMTAVTLTANSGYYFTNVTVPSGFTASVAANSASVTISGTPTANITINVSATAKTTPAAPSVTGVAPSSASGKGTLKGTTSAMEYKTDATDWADCVADQPVDPGSYQVRVKATNTTLASENVSVTVPAYVPDVNPDPKPNPETAPSIINGNGATAKQGEKKALSFTSSAARDTLVRVELDSTTLAATYYTVTSGSTVVTLNADFVATLAAGEHTLAIVSSNGTATANFTIQAASPTPDDPDTKPDTKPDDEAKPDDGKKADTKPDGKSDGAKQPPHTGDESNTALWLLLLVGSGAGMATLGKKKRYSK